MIHFDKLKLSSRRPLWLSSHPLDGVEPETEFPEKITEFISGLKEREIGAVTVLLPESELNRSQGDYAAAELASEMISCFPEQVQCQAGHFCPEQFYTADSSDSSQELICLGEHILPLQSLHFSAGFRKVFLQGFDF